MKLVMFLAASLSIAGIDTSPAKADQNCTTVAQCAQKAVEAARMAQTMVDNAVPKGAVMAFDLAKCPEGWSDLQMTAGRVIVGAGEGNRDLGDRPLTKRELHDMGGEEKHTLTVAEMPSHTHSTTATGNWGDKQDRQGVWGFGHDDGHGDAGTLTSAATGGSQPHAIMPPFVVLKYCVRQ